MLAAILTLAAGVTLAGTQPQLAAHGDTVYVAFGSGSTIGVARSDDAGASFGAPVVLPQRGRLALGKRRGPRIAVTSQAVLVAAIAGAKGGGADGDVILYRSLDRGATWTAPIVVNDVPAAAREGLHALAANASGLVVLAWLDLRAKGTTIHVAVSRDHGATWSADTLAYESPSGSICECCHPSVVVGADGRIAVLFRNQIDGNRDMYVVTSADGSRFGPAIKQGSGTWALAACPMDGGGAAMAGSRLTTIWRRSDQIVATAVDLAGPGVSGPEVAIGPGRDPVVAQVDANDSRIDLAFVGAEGIVLRQAQAEPVLLGRGSAPAIVASASRTLVAWEDQGRVQIRGVVRPPRPAPTATPARRP
jgi:hypothetical protein